jgi:hypothetical protein
MEKQSSVETIWKDGQSFTTDVLDGNCDVLRIKPDSAIHFMDGIDFNLKCHKLIVEGDVFFFGRGADGEDAHTPAPRPDVIQAIGDPAHHRDEIHPLFLNWATRGDLYPQYLGRDASPAGDGLPGAHISIKFDEYEGVYFDPKKSSNVSGGRGGKRAEGGLGCQCLCLPAPVCGEALRAGSGLASKPGAPGPSGSFEVIKTHKH